MGSVDDNAFAAAGAVAMRCRGGGIVMEKGIQLGQPIVAGPTSADFLFQKYVTSNHVGYKETFIYHL